MGFFSGIFGGKKKEEHLYEINFPEAATFDISNQKISEMADNFEIFMPNADYMYAEPTLLTLYKATGPNGRLYLMMARLLIMNFNFIHAYDLLKKARNVALKEGKNDKVKEIDKILNPTILIIQEYERRKKGLNKKCYMKNDEIIKFVKDVAETPFYKMTPNEIGYSMKDILLMEE